MEENDRNRVRTSELEEFLKATGLQRLVPHFRIGELDLAGLLNLRESDPEILRRIVDNHTDYITLELALTVLSKTFILEENSVDHDHGNTERWSNAEQETLELLFKKLSFEAYTKTFPEKFYTENDSASYLSEGIIDMEIGDDDVFESEAIPA